VTPVYLYNGQLRCALGDDLASASARYRAAELPPTQRYSLHEVNEERLFHAAAPSGRSLAKELDQLLRDCLGETPGTLDDCLLILASTTLDIGELEVRISAGEAFGPQLSTALSLLADQLRDDWGFAAAYTLNTACTSAANALLYGARLVARGRYRRALVLAFETPSALAMQGFAALGLVSPSGHYRPFHHERDGLLLGEAYSAVMLSLEPPVEPLARLLGGFSACDTSNLTTTREDGSHIQWVMQRALDSANCTSAEVGLVKLHGTATSANDSAEANGMQLMFGANLPPLCVLKPWLGHTLGACGLSESLLLLDALRHGPLPALDYAQDALLPLPGAAQALPADALLLSNFFGFGGNNASLVLQGVAPCA
jgi:3-oxoacyl-[acyl-carrier-protein] synthase-1